MLPKESQKEGLSRGPTREICLPTSIPQASGLEGHHSTKFRETVKGKRTGGLVGVGRTEDNASRVKERAMFKVPTQAIPSKRKGLAVVNQSKRAVPTIQLVLVGPVAFPLIK